eukprot:TRINITY_DN23034_c0_g1_i2.p2 TRINITY_DN23034_c0_g1~~TRINITY_DN23034_c0_g1_i2.p2  ORF type:complete len:187 (-),score=38.68 TRINITY_DN23034_c0_g1_i2:79-639(-)
MFLMPSSSSRRSSDLRDSSRTGKQSSNMSEESSKIGENAFKANEDAVEEQVALEDKTETVNEGDAEGEEPGECGFCLYMKGGGCRDEFIAWEKCVEEGEAKDEDIANKCFEITSLLKECMVKHSDYYEPILKVEKAIEEGGESAGAPAEEKSTEIIVEESVSNEAERKNSVIDGQSSQKPSFGDQK